MPTTMAGNELEFEPDVTRASRARDQAWPQARMPVSPWRFVCSGINR